MFRREKDIVHRMENLSMKTHDERIACGCEICDILYDEIADRFHGYQLFTWTEFQWDIAVKNTIDSLMSEGRLTHWDVSYLFEYAASRGTGYLYLQDDVSCLRLVTYAVLQREARVRLGVKSDSV